MMLVTANEPTAAQRRMYFHLVDVSDGMTPETGEAGGQPEIATNGAAFTATGIGVLVAMSAGTSGDYYADLTIGAVANPGDQIKGRYKSANTAECPAVEMVCVVAFDPYDALGLGLARLDAATSSRASQASVDSRASQASVDTKASQSSVDAKASQASLDSFAATVGTEFDTVGADISSLLDVVQTQFTLVRAKTDQLLFNLAGKVEAAITDAASFVQAAADRIWTSAARTLTGAVDITPAAVQGVWDAPTSETDLAGSIGRYLTQELANSIGEDIADPLKNIVPGAYESGTAGAALGRIGTGVIETVSPVSSKNLVRVTRGDDYLAVDGRAIPFTDLENMWQEPITSATFTARIGGVAALTKAALVSVGTGPGKQVLLELTSEETSALELGTPAYRFDIELVDPDGHKDTPIKGRMNVEEDQTHA